MMKSQPEMAVKSSYVDVLINPDTEELAKGVGFNFFIIAIDFDSASSLVSNIVVSKPKLAKWAAI